MDRGTGFQRMALTLSHLCAGGSGLQYEHLPAPFPPPGETMYHIFVPLAIGIILLNLIWQLFKNYGLVAGVEAEDPVKLTIRSVLFILLAYFRG